MSAASTSVIDFLIGSMIVHHTGRDDFDHSTRWPDIGSDEVRVAVLFEAEALFSVQLSDDDREGLLTVGDVVALFEGRADA
ncbi:hypothetical protein [Brevundimonas sp.]|uniref:hypothetical protein n=1 Tax=Brevundimonas sp. TaxID=1871086 RepID=UPI0035B0D73F